MELAAYTTVFAILCTKLVDVVRNAVTAYREDLATRPGAKVAWVVLPQVFGVLLALMLSLNVFDGTSVEGVDGLVGQLLTGLGIGATGSGWHEVLDALSGAAKKAKAGANSSNREAGLTQPDVPVYR